MFIRSLALGTLFFACSLQVTGEEQSVDQALQQQLTAQEQSAYRTSLGQASDEKERNQITRQYQTMVRDRAQPIDASKKASKHQNQAGASGKSHGSGTRSSPSGSKNKPQKSGR